jgi:oligosaccharide repeat unit polymerase
MTIFGFTDAETIPFLGITAMVLFIIASNYFKGYKEFWSPLTLTAVIFFYYCVLGPYQAVATGKTSDRLLNMRPFYPEALWGGLVFLLAVTISFQLFKGRQRTIPIRVPDDVLFRFGRWVCVIGFGFFTISTGGRVASLINPLDADAVAQSGGTISNYLGLSLNFLIPGCTILFLCYIRTRKNLLWFVVFFVVALGIFITLGFRYRLVLLLGSMAISYYLTVGRRPNILIGSITFFLFIAAMGIISEGRQYGRGIETDRLQGDTESYFQSGLNESRIFQTTGAVISLVPDKIPYVGIQPIISTILFPIPSAIYKEKKSAEYLFTTLDAIYGREASVGSAFLNYGEYYLAFGWFGIIMGGMLIGYVFKRLWTWYLSDYNNPLHVAVYAVTVSYLYVIISRGYLPQVVMLFFFSVAPVFVVHRLIRRQVAIRKSRAHAS